MNLQTMDMLDTSLKEYRIWSYLWLFTIFHCVWSLPFNFIKTLRVQPVVTKATTCIVKHVFQTKQFESHKSPNHETAVALKKERFVI